MLNKLIYMFDFIIGCIPDEVKRLLTFTYDIHSYITRSSKVFHIPKGDTRRFVINTLSFDRSKLCF